MTIVYSLRFDKATIESSQHATLTTEKYGFEPTHGLFGSEEWWAHIQSGELPIQTVSGVISHVYADERGAAWQGFTIATDDGSLSHWECLVNQPDQMAFYHPGKYAELDYVIQNRRSPYNDGSTATKCVIEIRIGA